MDENDVAFGVLLERNQWMRCPVCRHCVELDNDVELNFVTSVEKKVTTIDATVKILDFCGGYFISCKVS
ncbi:hypothetical protein L6452_32036 [Arctium lappa]|uniref:Uncharacterized protein n=1 Tax=Arctium lappa TaxID=4217 RepID=A0ACB8Z3D4_ARCLA|nr:hypothetical protein L6452_32036 [Arctium lappa]